jgi:KUP system potassium uptake protein
MMLVWFAVLGTLGALQIAQGPAILAAVSPHHAVMFFAENGLGGLGVLGSVFLVVTGGEALYADLGHFGRRPIQWGWFGLVLPALLLNYFGQGSLLLREPDSVEHLFYRMAPDWFLTPLVIFATYATVIASQAVITGICSLASQAVQLGYSPRLAILQTSSQRIGQIYVPSMNRVLLLGTLLLLVAFRSSGALASAYGIAVASTMLLTTVLVFPVVRERWGWSRIASVATIGAFLVPDVSFFVANLTKLDSGGWVPIAIAAVVYGLMAIWQSGRSELGGMLHEIGMPDDVFLAEIRTAAPLRVAGTAVYLTARRTGIPRALLHGYGAVHVLHESVLIVRVEAARIPVVPEAERVRVETVGEGILRAHVRYGFSEAADLPAILAGIDPTVFRLDPLTTTYFLARENLVVTEDSRNPLRLWSRRIFAFLSRNALDAARFFRLPPNRVIEIGIQIQI